MGKSRADIQKAYRERKKAREGSEYLRKETARVKTYYKATTELRPHKLAIRRERVRICMQKRRQMLKQAEQQLAEEENPNNMTVEQDDQSEGPCDSTSSIPCDSTSSIPCDSTSPSTPRPSTSSLVVDMKFKSRRGHLKKSLTLKKAESQVKKLELKVADLRKKNDSLRKKLERSNPNTANYTDSGKKKCNSSHTGEKGSTINSKHTAQLTPRSKSFHELRNMGVSPTKNKTLVKKLIFHNSLVSEIEMKVRSNRGRASQRSALEIVSGKLMKKYRLRSRSSRELAVHRGQLIKAYKNKSIKKRRQCLERTQMAARVCQFLERDDNSSCLPGKRDGTKVKSEIKQTRILNDYLYNLHLKFNAENPDVKTSLTTFSSYRQRHIKLVQYSARKTCLCHRHQNIALKAKGLKSVGAMSTDNPDHMIRQYSDEEIIDKIRQSNTDVIRFSNWKRKEVEHKGRLTKRMLVIQEEVAKDEFIEQFKRDLIDFRSHTSRVRCQFEQMQILKERLPKTHAICQMDFAENYSCSHADEIQTAYFDKCSVTLHPVVIYTRDGDNKLTHESFIYVSDTQSHTTGTVYAFIKNITSQLLRDKPNIDCVHYVTDSPTSQYRNKSTLYLIAHHLELFGLSASWQFWEAGHGKGPCDGVGGSSKRLADLAVKRQTAIIQSAEDYYNWGKSLTNSQTKYIFVPKEYCDKSQEELSALNIKPIKGTLEVHSIVPMGNGEVCVRNVSCFCQQCFSSGRFHASCDGWIKHTITYKPVNNNDNAMQIQILDETPVIENSPLDEKSSLILNENAYVAAVYNNEWYVGKILAYDQTDDELPVNVSFMETRGKGKVCSTFKWPNKEDSIWMAKDDILCTIDEPIPHGSRKMYKLNESDLKTITRAFETFRKA